MLFKSFKFKLTILIPMELPVFFPNVKPKSTKDLIIRILTEERSLTNQKIFNQMRRKFSASVTYQAVRQALTELASENVLEKKEKEYSLSIEWINSLDRFSSLLKKKFIEKKSIIIIDENTKEITLNSLNEMGHFILYSFKEQFFDLNNENDLYMMVHHLWFPFFDEKKRQALRDFFSTNNNYMYSSNNGVIDKLFSLFYKKYGKVKLGVKFDDFFDIIIQGDCITKIYMPKKLRERMDKAYSAKNLLNFRIIDEFSEMTYSNYPIRIIITRDKSMAEEMKYKIRKK